MGIAVATATSERRDASAAPPPTSPPPEDAASVERDEMEVEEEHASATEEADGMEEWATPGVRYKLFSEDSVVFFLLHFRAVWGKGDRGAPLWRQGTTWL